MKPAPRSSRLAAWLRRQLPACDAEVVEVRDGDEILARLRIPVGRPEELEAEIVAAYESSDSRTIAIVAVGRDRQDAASMPIHRAKGMRDARSTSGLLASVMRENDALRSKLMEQTETLARSLLAENARMAGQLSTLEGRRMELHGELEALQSGRAERELAERRERERSERQAELLRVVREEWAPAVFRHLQSPAEQRAKELLGRMFTSASIHAPDELGALVAKLPADTAAELNATLGSLVPANGSGKS